MEQPQQTQQEPFQTNHCYWHPNTETGLSCSQCGKHICTNCMVQAPVGIRCRECGRAAPMPTYNVSTTFYARAVGVALGMATIGGVLWAFLNIMLVSIPFIPSLIGIGVGYAIGELISVSVNRKRSRGLAWLAGGSVAGAYLISRLTLTSMLGIPLTFGIFGWGLLFFVVGVILAVQRVRP